MTTIYIHVATITNTCANHVCTQICMQICNLHRNLKPAQFLQTFNKTCKIFRPQKQKGLYDRSAASKPVKTALDLEIPTVAPAWAPGPRVAQRGEEDDEALTLLPLPMAPLLVVSSLSLHQALIPWKERGEKERDLLASTHIDKEKLQRDGGLKSSSSSSPMKVTNT